MYVLSKTKPWPEVYVGVYKTPKWYAKFQTVSTILMAAALGRETCQHAALVSSFYKLPALPCIAPSCSTPRYVLIVRLVKRFFHFPAWVPQFIYSSLSSLSFPTSWHATYALGACLIINRGNNYYLAFPDFSLHRFSFEFSGGKCDLIRQQIREMFA